MVKFDRILWKLRDWDPWYLWLKFDKILWRLREKDWMGVSWIWYDNVLWCLREYDWPSVGYSLNLDWINDYVTNNALTPYSQPSKTQAFTAFVYVDLDLASLNNINVFYTTRYTSWLTPNIVFWIHDYQNRVMTDFRDGLGGLLRVMTTNVVTTGKHSYTATYDWSWLATGVAMYIDWLLVPTTIISNTLVGDIINPWNALFVWNVPFATWVPALDWKIRWVSLVDYIKTAAEILADHNLWVQSIWAGSYLFAADFNRTSWLSFVSSDGNGLTLDIIWQSSGDWVVR
jgi:hypothetical protein